MFDDDDHIRTLMSFGLSFLQAKVYLNLVKLDEADVKTIAKTSKVARQDIYRIMPILIKMGLGENIIAKPTIYRATPLNLGLSILLQKRKEEYVELKKKESWLLNNFNSYNTKMILQEDIAQFKITSEITLILKLHRELIQKAHITIDVIIPFVTKPSKLVEIWAYLHELNMTKRSVKIRCITDKPKKSMWKQQALAENTNLEYKYLAIIPFGMHIFDKKEVTLSISKESGLPCLWSNNPNILMLAQNYFEELWNKTL